VPRYLVGIDVGGTFTDFSVFEETTGAALALKVPSTPPNFAEGIHRGLERLTGEHCADLGDIAALVHGTTIAVNAVIQRNGARLGLLVTEGSGTCRGRRRAAATRRTAPVAVDASKRGRAARARVGETRSSGLREGLRDRIPAQSTRGDRSRAQPPRGGRLRRGQPRGRRGDRRLGRLR
jgi:Hydantoinase/oxoprolinase N-terminal region